MIASDKQVVVVHMYVNACLPLSGGIIKKTTGAADVQAWSIGSYLPIATGVPIIL